MNETEIEFAKWLLSLPKPADEDVPIDFLDNVE